MGQRSSVPEKKDDGVTWWCRLLARTAALFAACVSFFFAIWVLITTKPMCIMGGIWQMSVAFIVLLLEGSWCCQCWPFLETTSKFAEARPYWQKGALYVGCSIGCALLCQSMGVWVGSGLVFASGVLYGLLALGKKGDRKDMVSEAQASQGEGGSVELLADSHDPD